MKATDIYPSKYLAAADLDGQQMKFTVESAEMVEVGQEKDVKLCLHLTNGEKSFIVNKTNLAQLVNVFGTDETDDWAGKSFTLGPVQVTNQAGKLVWSLRVVAPPPRRAGTPARTPSPAAEEPHDAAEYADEQASIRKPARH